MRLASDSSKFTAYEDKLKYASTVFPESLRVSGINPLKVIYTLVSEGIHSLSEEECVAIADETIDAFEFVFSKLRAEIEDRAAYEQKMKKLSEKANK
jgi:hypothetical protein